jgi:hypothetical protein
MTGIRRIFGEGRVDNTEARDRLKTRRRYFRKELVEPGDGGGNVGTLERR